VTELYRRIAPWRGYLFDVALAAAMVALSNVNGEKPGFTPQVPPVMISAWWGLSAAIVLGMVVQRRWPVFALALTGFSALGHQIVSEANNRRLPFPTLLDLAVPIVLYTVASRSRSRWHSLAALLTVAAAEVAVTLGNALIPEVEVDVHATPLKPVGSTVIVDPQIQAFVQQQVVQQGLVVLLGLALGYALGEATRTRHAHVRTLEQRAYDLEREQRQRIALAAAAERTRIGRDLHDIIAHSLSVIVAQAQAALAAQHRHPERTTQAVQEVITVGRESLAEMRRLVGAFGPDPDAHDRLSAPIGVAGLPTLIERVRAAGLPVQYTVDGTPMDLPAGVDISVYRIVQEALTNVLKHAGAGTQARVRLATDPAYVDVEVTDDGAGPSADPDAAHGNGLRGIAERVSLLGGTLTAGPNPAGGFLIRTRLPVPAGTP
jgi:signal transduction histidine kinase